MLFYFKPSFATWVFKY